MCHGVTPLPFLAHSWTSTGGCCRTAGACRRRLLTIDARRHHHLLVHMAFRLGHSNRHGNCKYRYRECLQHHLFLPSSPLLAGMMPRVSTQLLLIQFRLIWAIHANANEGKHCKLRTNGRIFSTIGLRSYHLWQLCNKEPKFNTTEPIKANLAENSSKLSMSGCLPSLWL